MTTIEKVTPEISELTREQVIAIEEACEAHEVPFGSMRVDAFHEGALIREACAQYWQPDHSTALAEIMWNTFPQGLLHCLGRDNSFAFPIQVRIILVYPVQDFWEASVKVPANRLGEVFAIAHDMYRHIYDLDDAHWRSEGHQDDVPRMSATIMNRAHGKYIWGHDIGDLVFESITFLPTPEWPKEQRKKMRFVNIEEGDGSADTELEESFETVCAPLDNENHANTCPFLGTIIFGIGS